MALFERFGEFDSKEMPMKMMFRIRLFIWSIWMRLPKPWLRRKYQKEIERMQQAVRK